MVDALTSMQTHTIWWSDTVT